MKKFFYLLLILIVGIVAGAVIHSPFRTFVKVLVAEVGILPAPRSESLVTKDVDAVLLLGGGTPGKEPMMDIVAKIKELIPLLEAHSNLESSNQVAYQELTESSTQNGQTGTANFGKTQIEEMQQNLEQVNYDKPISGILGVSLKKTQGPISAATAKDNLEGFLAIDYPDALPVSVLAFQDSVIKKVVHEILNSPHFRAKSRERIVSIIQESLKEMRFKKIWAHGVPAIEITSDKLAGTKIYATILGRKTILLGTTTGILERLLKSFGNQRPMQKGQGVGEWAQNSFSWLQVDINAIGDKLGEQKNGLQATVGKLSNIQAALKISKDLQLDIIANFENESEAQAGLTKLSSLMQTMQIKEKWEKNFAALNFPDPKVEGSALKLLISYPIQSIHEFLQAEIKKQTETLQKESEQLAWAVQQKKEKGLSSQAIKAAAAAGQSSVSSIAFNPLPFSYNFSATNGEKVHHLILYPNCTAAETELELKALSPKGKSSSLAFFRPNDAATKLTSYTVTKDKPELLLFSLQDSKAGDKILVEFKAKNSATSAAANPMSAFGMAGYCNFKVRPSALVK